MIYYYLMNFWVYILQCSDGSYYTGHTDNLEKRIGMHQSGEIPGFTESRLPIELVYSEAFSSREEALIIEKRIKGWSRGKKAALIRGDWDQISVLARKKHGI